MTPTTEQLEQFMQVLTEICGQSPSLQWCRQTLFDALKTAQAVDKLGADLAAAFKPSIT